jgi:hypothetical protein
MLNLKAFVNQFFFEKIYKLKIQSFLWMSCIALRSFLMYDFDAKKFWN